jgi:hypothetical protein
MAAGGQGYVGAGLMVYVIRMRRKVHCVLLIVVHLQPATLIKKKYKHKLLRLFLPFASLPLQNIYVFRTSFYSDFKCVIYSIFGIL